MESQTEIASIKMSNAPLFSPFQEHLKIPGNKRIFFSGKFGIGKTYFLNEFFQENSTDYEAYHLFPVNYQIASNEDIVEFLKYDLIVELLKKAKIQSKPAFCTQEDVGTMKILGLFLEKKMSVKSFLKAAISSGELALGLSGQVAFLAKLGRPMRDLLDLDSSFQEFKTSYQEGEAGIVDRFLEDSKKKNNLLESDVLSVILHGAIERQKAGKESVLILDDLDRIDPEHIFRILNVFSAHLGDDNQESANRFGFDKIVLVGDIRNIEHIFHHRYGSEADFSGYFNKFYSLEVFCFDNSRLVIDFVGSIIGSIQTHDPELTLWKNDPNSFVRIFLEDILTRATMLQTKDRLDLRELFRAARFSLPAFSTKKSFRRDFMLAVDISFRVLISVFGTQSRLFLVLRSIKDIDSRHISPRSEWYREACSELLPFISAFGSITSHSKELIPGSVIWKGYTVKLNQEEGLLVKGDEFKSLYSELIIAYIEEKQRKDFAS